MVDHDHVDSCLVRHLQRFVCHCAAIDRDDQARSLAGNAHQSLAGGPIAFEQAVGYVVTRFVAKLAHQQDEQRCAGRAVDVVVAIDSHGLAGHHCLGETVGGGVHVAEFGRVRQEGAQRRGAVAFQILTRDTAREQKLGDDIVFKAARTVREVHVAATPAPGLAGERAVDAEEGSGSRSHAYAIRLPRTGREGPGQSS